MSDHTPGPWAARIEANRGRETGRGRLYVETDQESGNEISSIICNISPYRLDELAEPQQKLANAALIAASPELFRELKRVEWSLPTSYGGACPCCQEINPDNDGNGHAPDCTLAAALAKATETAS